MPLGFLSPLHKASRQHVRSADVKGFHAVTGAVEKITQVRLRERRGCPGTDLTLPRWPQRDVDPTPARSTKR